MPYDLDGGDVAAVRARLGLLLGELHQTMLDVDTAPIFLFSDDRPRLVEARTRAIDVLDQWAADEPESVAGMYARLPDMLQNASAAESLLEAVTSANYFDLPIDLFNNPAPDSRVFAAAPDLVPLLDESGLVTVAGLDARPWGLHTGQARLPVPPTSATRLRLRHPLRTHRNRPQACRPAQPRGSVRTRRTPPPLQGRVRRALRKGPLVRPLTQRRRPRHALRSRGRILQLVPSKVVLPGSTLTPGSPSDGRLDGPLKGVEIEEFMPPPKAGDEWVFARYLHAIRDTTKKAFVHCDGAVKAFAAEGYPQTQQDFRSRGKGTATGNCSASTVSFPPASGPIRMFLVSRQQPHWRVLRRGHSLTSTNSPKLFWRRTPTRTWRFSAFGKTPCRGTASIWAGRTHVRG